MQTVGRVSFRVKATSSNGFFVFQSTGVGHQAVASRIFDFEFAAARECDFEE